MRRMKWRGYDMSFKRDRSYKYDDLRLYRIHLHLPFGIVDAGECRRQVRVGGTWRWVAFPITGGYFDAHGRTVPEATAMMMEKQYPTLATQEAN